MESLLVKSNKKVAFSDNKVKRSIYHDIQWSERLILLLGYRGVGKTTLMLQRLAEFGVKGIYWMIYTLKPIVW
jgi:predicted AAA+ superfamily ATPase